MMALEDAPRKYTKQVHLRLYIAHLSTETLESMRNLLERFSGKCPIFLCLMRASGEHVFVETHEKYSVTPSIALQQAVDEMFGEETYYPKVDTALPERQQRRWEKRSEGGAE
jgi:hypothetical protein